MSQGDIYRHLYSHFVIQQPLATCDYVFLSYTSFLSGAEILHVASSYPIEWHTESISFITESHLRHIHEAQRESTSKYQKTQVFLRHFCVVQYNENKKTRKKKKRITLTLCLIEQEIFCTKHLVSKIKTTTKKANLDMQVFNYTENKYFFDNTTQYLYAILNFNC